MAHSSAAALHMRVAHNLARRTTVLSMKQILEYMSMLPILATQSHAQQQTTAVVPAAALMCTFICLSIKDGGAQSLD